jgi:serine/threonine protein kinase
MEYVSNGKLLSYLRSHRTERTYYNNNDNYSSKIEGFKKTLSSADLVLFAYQIAKGMEFISSHGV